MIEGRWTPQAADDLQAIHDFIARDSPGYARAEVERIVAAVDRLEIFPDSGRIVPEYTAANYRVQLAGANAHERTPNSLAALAVGFGMFLDFARQVGAIDDDRYDALHGAADTALLAVGRGQRANVEGQKPIERYMSSIRALLLQGRAALAKPEQQLDYVTLASPQCRGIGWVDATHAYLVPDLAWAAVEEFNAREGWPYKKNQLHKQLADAGVIQRDDGADDAESRLTRRRVLGGGTKRVLVIARALFEEAINDPEANKKAAEQDEQARRDKLAESGIIIDDDDDNFEQLMN